ncbi:recombinase [Paenibacillus macquariensis subsp. defensor]|nr:recombinase [Paenibacillus macquariensis subsp. defensor]
MADKSEDEYCRYLRKSRADIDAEQRGEGETFERHERHLDELAKKLGVNVTKTYREVVSGETIAQRPEIQEMIKEVEDGIWAGVLVMEIERLARGDTIDQGIIAQTFKYSDTKIITPTKTYDPNNEFDEEYFEFGLFMSRREYKTINRRQQRGRIDSVKEGNYLGSISPYGYTRIKLVKEKGHSLAINTEEADIVKFIFELYTIGELNDAGEYEKLGPTLICDKLNYLKIPARKSELWVTSTVQGILKNPVYIGKIKWGSRPVVKKRKNGKVTGQRPRANPDDIILVDGKHDPIISITTWDAAQEIREQNSIIRVVTDRTLKNPLAGLAICGECGRKLVRRPYDNGYPDTLMCAISACSNVSSSLKLVEDRILDGLKNWLSDYKNKWESNKPIEKVHSDTVLNVQKNTITNIEGEMTELEGQLDNIHNLLEQNVYSVEMFTERSQLINKKLKGLSDSRDAITKEISKAVQREKTKKVIIPMVEHVIETYYATDDIPTKNELLKSVLEKVIYTKKQTARWHGSLDDFEIFLFPKSPRSH